MAFALVTLRISGLRFAEDETWAGAARGISHSVTSLQLGLGIAVGTASSLMVQRDWCLHCHSFEVFSRSRWK